MMVPIQVVGSAADKELVSTWSGSDSRDRQDLPADLLCLLDPIWVGLEAAKKVLLGFSPCCSCSYAVPLASSKTTSYESSSGACVSLACVHL